MVSMCVYIYIMVGSGRLFATVFLDGDSWALETVVKTVVKALFISSTRRRK